MNDEELTAAWLKAQAAVYTAHQVARSASHEETRARNALTEAKKAEAAAWHELEEHRAAIIDGRTHT